ncbi:MAG: hypothetical protein RQ801_07725 [Spirochaetaceae bacterium]|nr:hypothetical protein [Spirochaetaceae bacterium]MDT8298170.1 hypothetical protein [Spirochaetaceae bacterium]
MKRYLVLTGILTVTICYLPAMDLDITAQGGIGYSIVDIPASTDWNENYFEDWSELNYRLNIQSTWGFGDLRAGAELGYSWLYYYDVVVPPVPYYYYGYAGAFNIITLAEYRFKKAALQAGAGAYTFDDGTSFGIQASGTWRFQLRDPAMSIPLTIRADLIFGRALIIPVSIETGFSYRIRN